MCFKLPGMTSWVCPADDDEAWYILHKAPSFIKARFKPGATSGGIGCPEVRAVIIPEREASSCCAAFIESRSAVIGCSRTGKMG